ncbi:MAG: citramalate synthase [Nitrospirota bacterium]|jgi:2-isopropylmalate synthase
MKTQSSPKEVPTRAAAAPAGTVEIYDTTLRDGTQSARVSFSVRDKVRVAERLDELGAHYIEGGWPGANKRDVEFFEQVAKAPFFPQKVVAFGSTRHAKNRAEDDKNLAGLLAAGTSTITIFGKSWDLHVSDALQIELAENVDLIADSIAYLKSRTGRVIYDAEHFFDGYRSNPEYALATLRAAAQAGADCLVLCDTNGGTLPADVAAIFTAVAQEVAAPLGIHAHNDAEMAVANSIAAVGCGAMQVHGTINGIGERCGNANLCSVIPNLKLKLGIDCVTDEQLADLKSVSAFVYELANMPSNPHLAYVGDAAFAHKGGVHVSAVRRNAVTYEHVDPALVGNHQRILISDLAGSGNIHIKAAEYGIDLAAKSEEVSGILAHLKELESDGYQFEGAEASFELLIRRRTGRWGSPFRVTSFRTINERYTDAGEPISEASVRIAVDGHVEHTVADGNGPVHAIDRALRKALELYFPELAVVELLDYKVRVLASEHGTESRVRVLVESGDGDARWGTVGVSTNVVEASLDALMDAYEFKLLREQKRRERE